MHCNHNLRSVDNRTDQPAYARICLYYQRQVDFFGQDDIVARNSVLVETTQRAISLHDNFRLDFDMPDGRSNQQNGHRVCA